MHFLAYKNKWICQENLEHLTSVLMFATIQGEGQISNVPGRNWYTWKKLVYLSSPRTLHQVKVLKFVTKIFRVITNMHALILFGCKALMSVPGTTARLLFYFEDA